MARQRLLEERALLVTEMGPAGLTSTKEVAKMVQHYFGISKYEFQVFPSAPEPYIIFFNESDDRDRAFARGSISEGPYELHFHLWSLDRHGNRTPIPYHLKLSIEGIPQHAWFQEIAEKVLCDECVIHCVDEATLRREDQRAYVCWGFAQDPSRIPQLVYLTLVDLARDPRRDAQVQFTRPRRMKSGATFCILIHIDYIEDLMFYHDPPEEL